MVMVGVCLFFVRAENIERNVLVASLTLATSLISVALLRHDYLHSFRFGSPALLSLCLLAAFGFFIGRVLDFVLGARPEFEAPEGTLGTDLAD
jgi:hypothetical protein